MPNSKQTPAGMRADTHTEIDAGRQSGAAMRRQIDAYTHDTHDRTNIPPVGMAQYDRAESPEGKYAYDPHIDPSLQWAGKKEGASFTVPTSSIHIHESINPYKIIRSVQMKDDCEDPQGWLFESDAERVRRRNDAIEFYRHKDKWTNRLIAGDSLVIMNSLLEKEGMAGQVQMVYIDPPYGIKYGSNFQPFVDKRDVKDGRDEDLTQEPETVKAFRDTWELGIHSYLTYLRDRLLLARELLHESGSLFVQINDENVHYIRILLDEIFDKKNFIATVPFIKTTTRGANAIDVINDYLLWYSKDKDQLKVHFLYLEKSKKTLDQGYTWVEEANGNRRKLTKEELSGKKQILGKRFYASSLFSSGSSEQTRFSFIYDGVVYHAPQNSHWKTNRDGLIKLQKQNRLHGVGNTLTYVRYEDDFPYVQINNWWGDTKESTFAIQRQYVVQTYTKVISRCLLMTTDPGDLVLDITCGSGTTAFAAEQWGRRWITCDTSRIAITLAKKRLMTAAYDYYKLAYPEQGVSSGFVYKTVPHITLKSIANNEPPERETLYDQPEIDKKKIRVSGPFTVEAIPAPIGALNAKPLEDVYSAAAPQCYENAGKKQADWITELKAAGIMGRKGDKIAFSRVEALEGTTFLHAEAETQEDPPRRAVVCFAGETRPLDIRMVSLALDEAQNVRPKPQLIIFAAFQFDPAAAETIDDTKWPGVTLLKAQMNGDLMTEDLKKNRSSNQSFWLVGQPDIELIKIEKGGDAGKYTVKVRGFDYYDIKKGAVESGGTDKIAMWMLDADYDGMCVEPMQVFFPLEGRNDGWDKLAKNLRAEINQDRIEKYRGVESLPFSVKENSLIAVKIVDNRGIESLKIIPVRGYDGA